MVSPEIEVNPRRVDTTSCVDAVKSLAGNRLVDPDSYFPEAETLKVMTNQGDHGFLAAAI